ncbi:hypothetical protein AYI68_g4135 [Smittium mucronatum]|uniref:Uncharacterized protein n=1 Tax=Smittium mucronatum TaxID=133383 RepID=A0A1R0GY39_9FUNG|nr:hypothetical protein AYI68_g4135 [Smittium mucronatum]
MFSKNKDSRDIQLNISKKSKEILQKNILLGNNKKLRQFGDELFRVEKLNGGDRVVDFEKMMCSCGYIDELKISYSSVIEDDTNTLYPPVKKLPGAPKKSYLSFGKAERNSTVRCGNFGNVSHNKMTSKK